MKTKRRWVVLGVVFGFLVLCAAVFAYLALFAGFYAASDRPVGAYVGTATLDFLGDQPCYQVAANRYDQPIFIDPPGAFQQASMEYADAIQLIYETFGSEYQLEPFSEKNYHMYEAFGWQLPTDDEALRKQGSNLTKFLDIYENSEKRWFLTPVGWTLAPR